MADKQPFDELAEICLSTHKLIQANGTPEMKAIMRLLLFQIGQEIARRQTENRTMLDGG